jgi:hypothetical protein
MCRAAGDPTLAPAAATESGGQLSCRDRESDGSWNRHGAS